MWLSFKELENFIARPLKKQIHPRYLPIKKGAGRITIRPAFAPISLRATFPIRGVQCSLSGQDLAALGTAAGKNLAAVGSSHSLTETVHLGTVTLGGLVGTLHTHYTSSNQNVHMLDSPKGRSNTF